MSPARCICNSILFKYMYYYYYYYYYCYWYLCSS